MLRRKRGLFGTREALDHGGQVDKAREGHGPEVEPLAVHHVRDGDADPENARAAAPYGDTRHEVTIEHALG